MKVTLLASVLTLAFLTGACEKQSYSETRAFTRHGQHGGDAAGTHKSEGASSTVPHGGSAGTQGAAAAEKPAGH